MKDFILGDCMEGMKTFEDNFFDLAIVDPPYGLDLANMNMGVGKGKKASKIKNRKWIAKDWDKEIPTPEYFKELFRISKDQIIWGSNYFNLPASHGYVLWDKQIPLGLSFADCEMAWYSFKKVAKIFRYSAYQDKKIKQHPTQKPVQLYKWLLRNYAQPEFKILSTHVGSASDLIAFEDFGCEYVGYEIDKDYHEAALKRLNQHKAQLTIFND